MEQRMAQSYIDLFPKFVPDEKSNVSIAEQEIFYILIKNLFQLIFDEPLLLVSKLHDDDAFPNRFNKSSYGKPELIKNRLKFLNAMYSLLQNMFLMGQYTDIKINKRQLTILSRLGINDFSDLPKAWTWMSSRAGASLTAFSYCLFNEEYPYTSDIYARLLGEEAFYKLENWMISQGYKRFDSYNLTVSDCNLSLTYANPAWGEEKPTTGLVYKIKHTGISTRYFPLIKEPAVLGLNIPNSLKSYLTEFNSMDENTREFIVNHTKKCDNCQYCVMTNKKSSRPLAYIPVEYEKVEYNLCTYFPGYRFCWTSIDNNLAEQLIKMMSFMDKFA